MKKLKKLSGIICIMIMTIMLSCSKDDSGASNNSNNSNNQNNTSTDSYVKFSVNGSTVNGLFEIEIEDEDYNTQNIGEAGYSGATAVVYDRDTNEGTIRATDLVYTTWGETADDYAEVKLVLPAHIGPLALGEILTPQGWIEEYPTFYMTFRFLKQDAFYDENNDGQNDLITNLLSKTLSATITEVEETTVNGIPTLYRIKGSFEGTAYFKAYIDEPPTNSQELLHTVTGEFEYNLPID